MPGFFGLKKKGSSSSSSSSKDPRALLLGLDSSGKTAWLYKNKLGEVVTTIPTIGFNVETLKAGTSRSSREVTVWDVGAQEKIRPLWRHYVANTHFLVWTVAADEPDRVAESLTEFKTIFDHIKSDSSGCFKSVLFLATKMDKVANEGERSRFLDLVADTFEIDALADQYPGTTLIPCSSTDGEGLDEFRDWMSQQSGGKRPRGRAIGGWKNTTSSGGAAPAAAAAASTAAPSAMPRRCVSIGGDDDDMCEQVA